MENARVESTHKNHARPNTDGHGPLLYEEKMVCETGMVRGKGEARRDKANKPICAPHHPRYICIDVETKYVAKEGAEGTGPHTKTNNETTTRVMKDAYIHKPGP